jgi:hypothetical protein
MPSTRLKANEVTDDLGEQMRAAEEIWLVDPNHGMGHDGKHQWMELIVSVPPPVPDVVDPSAPQQDPVVLEIEVDSSNHEQVVQLREKIKRLCGQSTIESPQAEGSV